MPNGACHTATSLTPPLLAVHLNSTAFWPAAAVKVGGVSADAVGVAVGVEVEDAVRGAVADGWFDQALALPSGAMARTA